jgi:RNA ligase (TIGR02306 family)
MEEKCVERILAKVVRMGSIAKHPNADKLNVGEVGGWSVVVPLDIKEGDIGVYFEIDSMLPKDQHWVEKLNMKNPIIKTRRIRDVLSQGLFLPLSGLPEGNYELDQDVTEHLMIKKRPGLNC